MTNKIYFVKWKRCFLLKLFAQIATTTTTKTPDIVFMLFQKEEKQSEIDNGT